MIVCLCRRVSDRDITAAVQSGVDNFEILQDRTGVSSCCGCCLDCAREVFDTARARHIGMAASSPAGSSTNASMKTSACGTASSAAVPAA
jgi:bacterioferritin-associated ferredoxin